MLDKNSLKFIFGFLGILAVSFALFIAVGYYKEKYLTDPECCQAASEGK